MVGLLLSQQFAQPESGDNIAWQLLKLLLIFGIVVYLAIFVTRLWVQRGAGIATGPKQHLRLIEHLPLGAGKGLCLVKVMDQVLLLSVTDKAITVLREFPMSPELEVTPTAQNPSRLVRILSQLTGRESAVREESSEARQQSNQEFARELRERLHKLKEPKS
ncbi:MAG: flagellar biosynthetic protein FliO [Firmicutes bacterium]|nr:flagellar biosynthetic protein FliO [Bacillota bacterium]